MKGTDAVARFLAEHGVKRCFELIGGMTANLVDSFVSGGNVEVVAMHHEQAAAFAAEGRSRATRGTELGLAMGTSGPGAANLLTGVASCWFDSVSAVFLTGQVNTSEMKRHRRIRQQGFQELDIVSMARPVTKMAVQVRSVQRLLPTLHRALSVCQTPRRGPVLVDIPNDVQRQELSARAVAEWIRKPLAITPGPLARVREVAQLRLLCSQARRPLVLLGGGSKDSPRAAEWIGSLQLNGVPYVSSLLGQESLSQNVSYLGLIGAYGNRIANWAVQNCDLLIALGARMDVRQTGADPGDFGRNARIVQVDVDRGQLNNRVHADLSILTTADAFYDTFLLDARTFPRLDPRWPSELNFLNQKWADDEYSDWAISPHLLMQELAAAVGGEMVHYVCDVGNHQMWAAHSLKLTDGQRLHHSGGLGAMGFALPVGIGIAVGGERVVVISGDGGAQVNIQEFDTINRLRPRLGVVILNNESLGMVKNFQDMYFDGRNQSTRDGYSFPNFVSVALAYGIKAESTGSLAGARAAFDRMIAADGPYLVEIKMRYATECRPRLAFGNRLDSQLPNRRSARFGKGVT